MNNNLCLVKSIFSEDNDAAKCTELRYKCVDNKCICTAVMVRICERFVLLSHSTVSSILVYINVVFVETFNEEQFLLCI